MEDVEIIGLYFKRDETAIAETQAKYGSYCGHIAYGILANREDMEECLNDTWLSAWNSIPPQRPECLRVYLGCIVRNAALNLYNRYRARKRYQEFDVLLSELDECIPDSRRLEDEVDAAFLGRLISGWLETLEKQDRQTFLRRYWYGESVKLLAKEQGTTANAVSLRLKRLREKLKERLRQEGVML